MMPRINIDMSDKFWDTWDANLEFQRAMMQYWLKTTGGKFADPWSAYVNGWVPCEHCQRRNDYVRGLQEMAATVEFSLGSIVVENGDKTEAVAEIGP